MPVLGYYQYQNSRNLLHWAASKGNRGMARILLSLGADVNKKDPDYEDKTPLHSAVINNQRALVRILLDQGANVDAQDLELKTPLHYAITMRDKTLVRLLNRKNPAIDIKDDQGHTITDLVRDDKDFALFLRDLRFNLNSPTTP